MLIINKSHNIYKKLFVKFINIKEDNQIKMAEKKQPEKTEEEKIRPKKISTRGDPVVRVFE